MNRRTLIAGLTATAASTVVPMAMSAKATPSAQGDMPLSVSRTWNAALGSGSDIDRFSTTITAHASEDDAGEAFDDLLGTVQAGTLYNEESGAETIGHASFYVRYNDPNFVIDECTIRFGSLVYEFRIEAVHYGGARNAFRLLEQVFSRADTSATTNEALMALLPTAEEVAPYGLTEQVDVVETPAA